MATAGPTSAAGQLLPAGPRRRRRAVAAAVLVLVLGGAAVVLTQDGGAPPAGAAAVVEVDLRPPTRQPVLPPTARQPTEAGATAFTLFWFDTLNHALDRQDADGLLPWTGAGCRQCTGWVLGISRWAADGAELEGGLTVPVELAVGPFSQTEPVTFASTFLTTPATLTAADGTVTEYGGGRTRGGVTVVWANGRWQMTDVVVDARQPTP